MGKLLVRNLSAKQCEALLATGEGWVEQPTPRSGGISPACGAWLQNNGFVEVEWRPPHAAYGRTRFARLTPLGREARAALTTPEEEKK